MMRRLDIAANDARNAVKDVLKKHIQKGVAVSVTTDGWTIPGGGGEFETYTLHFVDKDGKLHDIHAACKQVKSGSSDHLREGFEEAMTDVGAIGDDAPGVYSVTTDSAHQQSRNALKIWFGMASSQRA